MATIAPSNKRKYAERVLFPSEEELAKVALLIMALV
jgi:hypothetical protein